MKNTIQDRIATIKKEGYALDFGNVFNHAFENYKKIALYAGLVIFVFFFLLTIIGSIALIAIFGAPAVLDFFKPENLKPEEFGFTTILIISGVSIILGSLLSPLTAGLIKMAYCAENDEEFHVSTMFEFYKSPFFKELFMATFLVSLMSSIISNLINYIQIPVLNFVTTVILTLFTVMMIPLIIFGKLKAVEAIEASIIIVSKQTLTLLGLIVIGYIATMVGFIGCCVGVLFTIPFMYSLYYAIYSEIIGFEPEDELEELN